MNPERTLLLDSVRRLLGDHCDQKCVEAAKSSGWSESLWRTLEQTQVPLVGVAESAGGAGGTLSDAAAVLRLAGEFSAPVPLAETGVLAGWMLASSGMNVPPGPLAAGPAQRGERLTLKRARDGWSISGMLERMPWAAVAKRLVVFASNGERECVVSVDPQACTISSGANLASEPRNDVRFDGVAVRADDVAAAGPGVTSAALFERGALARSLMMAGALERCLALSVRYAGERVQFGRPIAQFQAIQQELARLAGEVAAARAAAEFAAGAMERGTGSHAALAVASAKIRAGEAALAASAIAHQVHGAIGATREYVLHHSTLRLWAWRSEFGSDTQWAEVLGQQAIKQGADALWPWLTLEP